jgi:hypothetical protein
MQITIYIQKDDEQQFEAMKEAAKEQKVGIGAYIVRLDTEARLRFNDEN